MIKVKRFNPKSNTIKLTVVIGILVKVVRRKMIYREQSDGILALMINNGFIHKSAL